MSDLPALVARSQSGELAAFGELVSRFQDMALGYAHAVLGDYHLAQDAAQEAFVEAHANLSKLNCALAFPNWLRRIVFKHCDRLVRGERSLVIRSVEETLLLATSEKSPADMVEEKEVNLLLHRAMEDLSEQERQIVWLFYISDHSQQEIAAFLDLSVHVIKNRLRSARRHLKESLLTMTKDQLKGNRPSRDERFVDGVLRLVAPQQSLHSEGIYKLFTKLGRDELATMGRMGRIADSRHDWKASRVGFVDDQIATYFGLYDLELRIGSARVRTAGENLCYTHPDYGERFGDAMDQTARAAIAALREQGYNMAISLCKDEFLRYGFVPVWRANEWTVATAELPEVGSDLVLEEFDLIFREDLAEIYNCENELLTGSTVRPTYLNNKEPGGFKGWLWKDEAGSARGYVAGGDEGRDVYIDDHAGPVEEVLQALAMLARRAEKDVVRCRRLHDRSALGRALKKLPSCAVQQMKGRQNYYARIVNAKSLFEKLAPELARRLAQFPLLQWCGDLVIAVDGEEVALRIKGGDINIVETDKSEHAIRGGQEIARLLLGADVPEEVVAAGGIELSGDAEQLIKVLFPAQQPQMRNQDL
jgi:RNA polymerase sigma factor (sigma-70 family)